ncbi:hypothetical protein F8M41_014847 [Gigaspora margarita]|uniref:Uncharacterized protein n=1 Tax=Gigaspora margarita TaxID=4874 RepID=A0A8H3ZZN8_GIGMA|nr:hypothetical protein F8M41_014847 [Gigaspora margarita]
MASNSNTPINNTPALIDNTSAPHNNTTNNNTHDNTPNINNNPLSDNTTSNTNLLPDNTSNNNLPPHIRLSSSITINIYRIHLDNHLISLMIMILTHQLEALRVYRIYLQI